MTKVKKETKVVKSPNQKVKKINKTQLKQKPIVKKKLNIVKTQNKEITKNVDTDLNYDKLNIDLNQVQRGVEALLQYTEKNDTTDLFKGQQQIFVQLTCIRIPSGANRKFRIKLQHPLINFDNEICLIVPDLKRGRKVEHEETVEHYETLLREKNVTYIKRILPIRQLRVEYDQFELKRRLSGYYDYFLVDGRISGHVLHLLGKTFDEKRKRPVPIQMNSNNLNDVILKALSKTELNVHSKGDTYIVQIGHTEMPLDYIIDNLKTIINFINSSLPGAWNNIRSLHVKTDKSIAIPIYYSLKPANEVQPPKVKRDKLGEVVTDELSTRKHTVTVHPDGHVVLNDPVSKKKLKAARTAKRNAKAKGTLHKIKKDKIKKKKLVAKKVKTEVNGKSPKNKKVKTEPKSVTKVKKEKTTPIKIKTEK